MATSWNSSQKEIEKRLRVDEFGIWNKNRPNGELLCEWRIYIQHSINLLHNTSDLNKYFNKTIGNSYHTNLNKYI